MAQDFYQLRVQGLHQTEYNECVLHYRGTNLVAADYLSNATDLIDAWEAEVLPDWLNLFPGSYQLMRLTAKKASVGGGAEMTRSYQFNANQGLQGGGAASQQLCPVVLLIPPMGTKTAGKIFLPCIAEGDIAANVVSAGWTSRLSTVMTILMTGFSASAITWDQSIFSKKNQSFAEVVDYSTSPIVGFQRRRQRAPL